MDFPSIIILLCPLLSCFPLTVLANQDAPAEQRSRRNSGDYYGSNTRNYSMNYRDNDRYNGRGRESYDEDRDDYGGRYRNDYDEDDYNDRYNGYGNHHRRKHAKHHTATATPTTTAPTTATTVPADACIAIDGFTCSTAECSETYFSQQPIKFFVTPASGLTSCLQDGQQVAKIDACTVSSSYAPAGVDVTSLISGIQCTPTDSSFAFCFQTEVSTGNTIVVSYLSTDNTCATTILQQTRLDCLLSVYDSSSNAIAELPLAIAYFALTISPATCTYVAS